MKKIGELKSILPKEIYSNVRELLDAYAYGKCDYLCISFETWERLFIRIICELINETVDANFNYFMGKVVERVNIAVGNFINRKIKEGKIYILDNLFIKLKSEGYRDERLLAMFLLELNCLYVDFTEVVFNLLKDNSKKFNKILSAVGFRNLSYEEFVTILNKNYGLNISIVKKEDIIDYDDLVQKYSSMTYEEFEKLFGDSIGELPQQSINLLQRYFAKPDIKNVTNVYDVEKEVSLLLNNYKRKNINLEVTKLRKAYLANKYKFSQKQALYLECFVLGLKDKNEFTKAYPDAGRIAKFSLISKLEKLYYGIYDLFDTSLSKEQYLEVLNSYPEEASKCRSDILNYYYGINCNPLSIKEISKIFGVSYDEMKELIRNCRNYCLSLYCNINTGSIDKKLYIPYVLDDKYDLNPDVRKALKLFLIDGKSYEEISKEVKGKISTIISMGLQKIDEYRFGISCPNSILEDQSVEVLETDILEEINRHPSESILNDEDKKFLSYFLGLKTSYNVMGEKLNGAALQEKLNAKSRVKVKPKYDDLINKIQQRKLGILEPELLFIPREELISILDDCHLPISDEERYIICSLLEIKEQPLKTLGELAQELGVTSKSIKRKYKLAIVNIKKYMVGEKEGTINYEYDVIPVLKYFTFKERELLYDYYVSKLLYKDITKKYDIPLSRVKRIMYRIKTYLVDIIKNPQVVRFDYDYYHQVVNMSDFPYRGNLEQAKRIFDLYVGETTFGRADTEEIKDILGLDMPKETVKRIIDNLILSVFKYKDGIRKENGFSLKEVREFYEQSKSNLSSIQLQMFANLFNKNAYVDYKISGDLIFLMMKGKNINSFDISKASKEEILKLLCNLSYKFTKKVRNTLMFYGNILERELMSGSDINHVFRILNNLDRRLPKNESMNRVRKSS